MSSGNAFKQEARPLMISVPRPPPEARLGEGAEGWLRELD